MKLFLILKNHWYAASGKVAKKRLKKVITSDRIDCSANVIKSMRTDVIRTISKYAKIDEKQTSMTVITEKRNDKEDEVVLLIKVPFKEINKVIC